MRHLALVALYHLNYEWAMNQLIKESKKEQEPILKKQLLYMINEYNKSKQSMEEESKDTE